jgi:hypothetical protein
MRTALNYLAATRHPWPCLLFVMPLLLFYEGGMVWLRSRAEPLPATSGVEAWISGGLDFAGLNLPIGPPLVVVAVCLLWAWLRWKKPAPDIVSTWFGIAVESVLFALGLWGLWEVQGPLLRQAGLLQVSGAQQQVAPSIFAVAVSLIGTGVYEETLFRLLCLTLLAWLLRWVVLLKPLAVGLAILLTAVLFAAAHQMHVPFEEWKLPTFIFHTVAGLYFGLLYYLRGFGVAVGAHACFNVLVTTAV